jgi:flagellar biosynthesis/type III secretory pathway ATPase
LQSSLRTRPQLDAAERVRALWTRYLDVELLIQMGEYKPGGDPRTDEAVQKYAALCDFLRQDELVLERADASDERMARLLS